MREFFVAGLLAVAFISAPAWAQDGAALFQEKGCTACHGPQGDKAILDTYPNLAGQNEAYLLQQMKDIKSGARDNGLTAAMKPTIANVSEEEMQTIAKWLSSQAQ